MGSAQTLCVSAEVEGESALEGYAEAEIEGGLSADLVGLEADTQMEGEVQASAEAETEAEVEAETCSGEIEVEVESEGGLPSDAFYDGEVEVAPQRDSLRPGEGDSALSSMAAGSSLAMFALAVMWLPTGRLRRRYVMWRITRHQQRR